MKIRFLPLLVLCAACDGNDVTRKNEPNLRTLSASEIQAGTGINKFAFKLFKEIQEEKPANTFVSPFSVSTALAMTLNGAGTETQKSILNTIDFGDLTPTEVNEAYKGLSSLLTGMDKTVELGLANSVWYRNTLHVQNDFSKTITESYDGTVQGLDFGNAEESKRVINGWVEQKTHDRIKNLIEGINPDHVMFLVNAIYFKGDWTYRFDKSKTNNSAFFTPDGEVITRMMHSTGVKVQRYETAQIQLVDIPYGNEQFRLTVIMPHNPSDLQNVIDNLNEEDLNLWLSEANEVSVELELPKFKMEWKNDLIGDLQSMGMEVNGFPKLFQEQLNLAISAVIHQSFLDVNEEGSEAAAATAVGVELTSVGPGTPGRIELNKSFVFAIREKHTGAILFLGQLVDPSTL